MTLDARTWSRTVFVATAVSSLFLAAILTMSAARKLSHDPDVVESYRQAGVPEHHLNLLAYLLLAGAVGLTAGLLWALTGVAAALGLTGYFVGAITAHVRAGDARHLPMPTALLFLSMATAALRIASL